MAFLANRNPAPAGSERMAVSFADEATAEEQEGI
jgi:hypothetical protein